MDNQWIRTEWLIGSAGLEKLAGSTVAVFGLGGVGSYTVEALCRSGIGRLILIDYDRIALSNLNRQLIATHETIGRLKVDVAAERVRSINPKCQVISHALFWPADISLAEAARWLPAPVDYLVDAIDTVSAKINLVEMARAMQVPIVSCMGTGNKRDPDRLQLTELSRTHVCPLARVMRRELKKRGIDHLKVVFSDEQPARQPLPPSEDGRRIAPASIAFVPAAAGLLLASAVVNDLLV